MSRTKGNHATYFLSTLVQNGQLPSKHRSVNIITLHLNISIVIFTNISTKISLGELLYFPKNIDENFNIQNKYLGTLNTTVIHAKIYHFKVCV